MSTVKLVAGTQAAFASLMTTELNSLASGDAIIGSTSVDNGANNELMAEFSFTTGGSITPSGSPFIGLFLYPQNGDGTSYGDGRFGSAAAAIPPSNYFAGFLGLPAAAGTQTGFFTRPGSNIMQIPLPRGVWKPVLYNASGVALSASGNILYYRTVNLSVA